MSSKNLLTLNSFLKKHFSHTGCELTSIKKEKERVTHIFEYQSEYKEQI